MTDSFLGRGWRFPILPDNRGGLGYVEEDANVEQSLRLLLLTALGERVMRPDFGCKASRLVFAPGSTQYLSLLQTTVREALRDWEKRVEVQDVRAEADPLEENRVTVSIEYRVRGSDSLGNLVFPFYLNAGRA